MTCHLATTYASWLHLTHNRASRANVTTHRHQLAFIFSRIILDDGSWAVISVTDHGPGIESEMLSRVFERFATGNRYDGLGLGLYLSHRIVEAHGGTLTVESSVGTGTTFWLALPCRER